MDAFTTMEVLSYEAKDVHVVMRISASNLTALLDVLDKASIEGADPEKYKKFEELRKFFEKIEEDLRNDRNEQTRF